jgi:hypothetical protein
MLTLAGGRSGRGLAIVAAVAACGWAATARAEATGQGSIRVSTDIAGAEVLVDGAPYGRTPEHTPISVAPGTHQVVVRAPGGGARVTVAVELAAGETRSVNVQIGTGPTIPAADGVPAGGQRWRRAAIWGTAGGAVLGLAVGITAFEIAQKKQRDFNAYRDVHIPMCSRGLPQSGGPACADLLSAANTADTWTTVGLFSAGVLAASALVLWLTTPAATESAMTSRIACAPALDHLGLGCVATF